MLHLRCSGLTRSPARHAVRACTTGLCVARRERRLWLRPCQLERNLRHASMYNFHLPLYRNRSHRDVSQCRSRVGWPFSNVDSGGGGSALTRDPAPCRRGRVKITGPKRVAGSRPLIALNGPSPRGLASLTRPRGRLLKVFSLSRRGQALIGHASDPTARADGWLGCQAPTQQATFTWLGASVATSVVKLGACYVFL